jgi:hypothetical protein
LQVIKLTKEKVVGEHCVAGYTKISIAWNFAAYYYRGMKQQDMMKILARRYGNDEARIIREYANAERNGRVQRRSNINALTPEQYASRLLRDGQNKGWLNDVE